VNPPAEGFNLDMGEPTLAIPRDKVVYLRSFGDDFKALMKAYIREHERRREHPDWLGWCTVFADWL